MNPINRQSQMIHELACGKKIQECYEGLSRAVDILEKLPSAESDQKTGKRIKKHYPICWAKYVR